MVHLKPDVTIEEILGHPRYREFAQACTEKGRQVVPDAFPWRLMGRSDDDILAEPMRFEHAALMSDEAKRNMLLVIRAQEQLVREWWDWWLSWEWIVNSRRPAPEHIDDDYARAEAARADRRVATTPPPPEGWLF